MVVFPNCKINLGLHVLRKRADGFHDIETCFYPVMWTDILEVVPNHASGAPLFQFSSSGRLILDTTTDAVPLDPQNNIIYKAYGLIKAHYQLPALKVHLHKTLPMGAGLGGGSSNAAFFIDLINTQFQLNIALTERKAIAAQLGSDCAFFIENKPLLAKGRGELLEPINLNLLGKTIVVVHPNIHSDTKGAYAGIEPNANQPDLKTLLSEDISNWKHTVNNAFELSIGKKYPEILKLKSQLYELGASYAAMSGSGSAIFGLFETADIQIPKEWNAYSVYKGLLT